MKPRILIVDDEPALTRMTALILERTGRYEVRVENLARNVVNSAREFQPQLVLLDVIMPGLLDSDVARLLQEDAELKSIRIAFMTAIASKEEQLRLDGRIGGYPFIAKPVNAEELLRFIDTVLAA